MFGFTKKESKEVKQLKLEIEKLQTLIDTRAMSLPSSDFTRLSENLVTQFRLYARTDKAFYAFMKSFLDALKTSNPEEFKKKLAKMSDAISDAYNNIKK